MTITLTAEQVAFWYLAITSGWLLFLSLRKAVNGKEKGRVGSFVLTALLVLSVWILKP